MYIDTYKLSNMCDALDINKKTYDKYKNFDNPDYYDYLIIKEIFDDSKGTYGYRRITEGLKIKYGVIFNHKKVQRIMKKYNLKAKYVKKSKIKDIKELKKILNLIYLKENLIQINLTKYGQLI
ncbi:IS3 family transposase [Clostridium perfringens]|uniref:IS3 family transposase n=1 Tax=Clostridium perfringens TaxID=1502 RepID=UPI0013E34B1B|nr:IS3 family transposase [Clostridium perfringens]MDT7931424.1 transposase [Clostridium perfringens]MDT7955363.1 transposase [Clostridium perfringens]